MITINLPEVAMPIYKTGKFKDGKQQYRVCVNFTDGFGKYRQISRCVYGAAAAKQTELELQHKAALAPSPASISVGDFYKEYICDISPEIRRSSLVKKQSRLENHVLPLIGDVSLKKLSVPILQDWKNTLNGKDLMISTKHGIYTELNAMLNHAVKKDYIPQNPLKKVGNFKDPYSFSRPEDAIRYYTADEFKRFFAAVQNHLNSLADFAFFTFFALAFYTGMRKGEINALKWCDIQGDVISVSRSVSQKLGNGEYMLTPPKNRSSVRKLQMPNRLLEVLARQKAVQQQNSPKWSDDFFVCGGINCLGDTAIAERNLLYAAEAGLPPIRIHDFRHTHATLLINEGISIQEIARRLGHADVTVTWKVYAHLYPREEERAVKVLDNI